jgi:NDP-sugar pyrophosphorylase family protein
MQLVVPMAGLGRRFAEAGYRLPKPLIPIAGVPMVVRAVRELPAAERIVLVCHPEHVARHQIDRTLRSHLPGCRVVVASGSTAGQACSVRLAADELALEEPVLVAACDNTHLYDARRFRRLASDPSVDCLVWTYRHDPRVLVRPEWYGWVRVDTGGDVLEVSVKRPLSDTPINDHVVSGCFWFRTAQLMLDAIDRLVAADLRVRGEFYLDSVPNLLVSDGRRVQVFEVDKYIGWGTPEDLEDYERWQRHFGAAGHAA